MYLSLIHTFITLNQSFNKRQITKTNHKKTIHWKHDFAWTNQKLYTEIVKLRNFLPTCPDMSRK